MFFLRLALFGAFVLDTLAGDHTPVQECPEDDQDLIPWSPGNQPGLNVEFDGEKRLLTASATLNSLTIRNGGKLVIADNGPGGDAIVFTVKYIYILRDGEMHVGSETCRYESPLEIVLSGLSTDPEDIAGFGRKFIGVATTGTLEIHGPDKMSWTYLASPLAGGSTGQSIIDLADDGSSWGPGDRVVIASTDYNMYQAEEFDIVSCPECNANQIKISGDVQYNHYGFVSNGVDMRGEVGLLTRNIKIYGEVQDECYGDNFCEYFDYDTFGGQTQFYVGFKNVHLEGFEMYNMGQHALGNYPIHFHRCYDVDEVGEYSNPSYVKQASLHDLFSRCVTVHTTDGLLIEDVVGYNTLGHCFFLEDGPEQRNILRHNLGLVTKPGVLLPSDRDENMCLNYRDKVHGDYVPVPDEDCMGVSTYWIAHPNNILEDNSAAGSAREGFHFVFHRVPTGLSPGMLEPFHGERSALASFVNNRAHSNGGSGLMIDQGVKIDDANEDDPRENQAISDYARFMPCVNRDPTADRIPAIISAYTAYKNNEDGAFVRGGDIFFESCRFADNGVGLTMASENTFPYQAGAHQEVRNSIFVGESNNMGSNDGISTWALGGDGRNRTLPGDVSYPFRGVQIYDGPVLVEDSSFANFWPTADRNVSAIAFYPQNSGQNSPANAVNRISFSSEEALKVYLGAPGGIFGSYDDDGDLTQIVHDVDGSMTGTADSYVIRQDNMLMQEGCQSLDSANAVVCTGIIYGQAHFNASTKSLSMTVVREGYESYPVTLKGANRDDDESTTTNYQPVVMMSERYSVHWDGVAPASITVSAFNFEHREFMYTSLCYPVDTTFDITYEEWDQMRDEVDYSHTMTAGSSQQDVENDQNGWTYYWDNANRLLHLKLMAREPADVSNPYNYCAGRGCERIHIEAQISNQDTSDCRA